MAAKVIHPVFQYAHGSNRTFMDNIPPEMYDMIDPYWHNFQPLEPVWFTCLSILVTCLGLTSITGNFLVMYIFTSTRALRTPSNLYVVNLALSDFCMMFTMFPPLVLNGYHNTWSLGPFICEIYGFLGSLFGCVSIWTMTLIACDRYNVIVLGITNKPLTNKMAVFKIFLVWLSCGGWAIAPWLGWNRYVPEGNMTTCGCDYFARDLWNASYILLYTIWCYLVPLVAIVYSYYYILKVVREHEKSMREQAAKMNVQSLRSADGSSKSAEIKLAKIALCTITLWFIAWTPYSIINIAGIFGYLGDGMHLTPLSSSSGVIFAKANAVYNPIVYGLSHPKYQAALAKKVPCLACKKDVPPSDAKTISTVECESSA